jgi:hypothetical protein
MGHRRAASLGPVGEDLDGLLLRYVDRDSDATGELWAQARFGDFAGASSAWFSDDELVRFADQLSTHPLGELRCHIAGGGNAADESFEEYVGLTVGLGMRGQVGLIAHLALPTSRLSNAGSARSEARVEVLTTHGALQRFSSELRQLVAGTEDRAWLEAVAPGNDSV